MRLAATLAVALVLAGCLAPQLPHALDGRLQAGGVALVATAVRGAVSELAPEGDAQVEVVFPEGTLVVDAGGRLLPAKGAVSASREAPARFLAPYGAAAVDVVVDGAPVTVPLAEGEPLVSGMEVVRLLRHQEANFPHRTPGMPNYAASQAYFADFLEGLGYEVEVDPYGTMALDHVKLPGPRELAASSVANVVAYKRGTMSPERYLVFGGHYDMVEQTTHAAFDNSGGSMATLVMAKAFADIATEHTLVFALWGGEEDGVLGSRFWVETNLDKVPYIDGYYNFDVTGIAWPAPAPDPAPVVVTAGPDGPVAATLHAYSTEIETTWLALPEAVWDHQPMVVGGQVGGAGVNAQSDHGPFATNGIPAYMPFTSRVDHVRAIIHKDSDTLENMTKYALAGMEGPGQDFTAAEMAEGERLVARSFETQMYHGFYWAVLTDAGHFKSARAGLDVRLH